MTYPRAYIAVAIHNFKIVEWLALQIERDFSTVTASLIHFLGFVDMRWIWDVWWFVGRLKSGAVVHIDLQWLRVKVLQGAGLELSSISQIWMLLSGIQTLIAIDGFSPCFTPITGVPQFGQNFSVSEQDSTGRYVGRMYSFNLVHQSLFAKRVTLQSAFTLLHYEIINGCRKSPQQPFLE